MSTVLYDSAAVSILCVGTSAKFDCVRNLVVEVDLTAGGTAVSTLRHEKGGLCNKDIPHFVAALMALLEHAGECSENAIDTQWKLNGFCLFSEIKRKQTHLRGAKRIPSLL